MWKSSVTPTHQDLSNDTTFSQILSRVPVPLRNSFSSFFYNNFLLVNILNFVFRFGISVKFCVFDTHIVLVSFLRMLNISPLNSVSVNFSNDSSFYEPRYLPLYKLINYSNKTKYHVTKIFLIYFSICTYSNINYKKRASIWSIYIYLYNEEITKGKQKSLKKRIILKKCIISNRISPVCRLKGWICECQLFTVCILCTYIQCVQRFVPLLLYTIYTEAPHRKFAKKNSFSQQRSEFNTVGIYCHLHIIWSLSRLS